MDDGWRSMFDDGAGLAVGRHRGADAAQGAAQRDITGRIEYLWSLEGGATWTIPRTSRAHK